MTFFGISVVKLGELAGLDLGRDLEAKIPE